MPGRKKSDELKVIEGTFNPTRDVEDAPEADGAPEKPRHLKGLAGRIWKEVVDDLPWLGKADSYTLAIWCGLEAEHREGGIQRMDSARITQYRLLANDLGMTPGGRAKLGTKKSKKGQDGGKGYFT